MWKFYNGMDDLGEFLAYRIDLLDSLRKFNIENP